MTGDAAVRGQQNCGRRRCPLLAPAKAELVVRSDGWRSGDRHRRRAAPRRVVAAVAVVVVVVDVEVVMVVLVLVVAARALS